MELERMNTQTPAKRGFSTREAGHYIGRSASWLRKQRLRSADDPGDPGPRYFMLKTGSAIYLREDLDAWLDQRAANATDRNKAA
jgi:hypothetical protein